MLHRNRTNLENNPTTIFKHNVFSRFTFVEEYCYDAYSLLIKSLIPDLKAVERSLTCFL